MMGVIDPETKRGSETTYSSEHGRTSPSKELEQLVIRWVVTHRLLPFYDVDEEDAVILLSILVETGIVDHDEYFSGILGVETFQKMHWTLLNDGRTICEREGFQSKFQETVHLHPTTTNTDDDDDDDGESSSVETTEAASHIGDNCKRRGRRITTVFLGDFSSKNWKFHTERVFELLSKLDALEILVVEYVVSFRLTDTVASFPNLKYIEARSYDKGSVRIGPLAVLEGTKKKQEASSLEHIVFSNYKTATEADLEEFLFDVLPFLPNLTTFEIDRNRIESFQRIAQRIHNDNKNNNNNEPVKTIASRLRRLNLGYYHFITGFEVNKIESLVDEPKEVEAVKTILVAFRELSKINGAFGHYLFQKKPHRKEWNAGVDHLMDINHTGRMLVESCRDGDLPLSIWPVVLERAWKQKSISPGRGSDGIYYLLKKIQALRV